MQLESMSEAKYELTNRRQDNLVVCNEDVIFVWSSEGTGIYMNILSYNNDTFKITCNRVVLSYIIPDSSMVEHTAVNRGVVGSSPTRGVWLF